MLSETSDSGRNKMDGASRSEARGSGSTPVGSDGAPMPDGFADSAPGAPGFAESGRRPPQWLSILGADHRHRLRTLRTLQALVIYALFYAALWMQVAGDLVEVAQAVPLTLFNLGGGLAFFLLVRLGWSERLAPREPGLTEVQCIFALSCMAWAYAIMGATRGTMFGLVMLLFIFYGQFRLARAVFIRLTCFAILAFVVAMVAKAKASAGGVLAREEMVQFVYLLVLVLAAAYISFRQSSLRARLSQQRKDLAAALELNRRLAHMDSLTGVMNRRAMTKHLARAQRWVDRGSMTASVVLLDLDHFKRINDTHGHAVGDHVLRMFAQCLAAAGRSSDLVCRWGGEEFLWLLPGCRVDEALDAVGRLRTDLQRLNFEPVAPGLQPTLSAGVTQLAEGDTLELAIERSDRALYAAKQAGRDRAEVVSA